MSPAGIPTYSLAVRSAGWAASSADVNIMVVCHWARSRPANARTVPATALVSCQRHTEPAWWGRRGGGGVAGPRGRVEGRAGRTEGRTGAEVGTRAPRPSNPCLRPALGRRSARPELSRKCCTSLPPPLCRATPHPPASPPWGRPPSRPAIHALRPSALLRCSAWARAGSSACITA